MPAEKTYTERIMTYVKPETIEAIKAFAEEHGYTVSRATAVLLERVLKEMKKEQ